MKMMKKLAAMLLAGAMVVSLAACGSSAGSQQAASDSKAEATGYEGVKVGLITLHDENSTYDLNFINGMKEVASEMGFELVMKNNIGEDNSCYETACEMAEEGCVAVFADSFGHESYMIEAAKEYPNVQFCHATGTRAHTEGLSNYHNAFASIYEGRYLAGIVAGMKLNEMIEAGTITAEEAKMGYVGAFTYAEVMSGYTSFYLGAKSVCPTVTMDVTFTGSWYDETAEKEGAQKLIAGGCVLISQHADSMGAPTACEDAGVPNISYNGSTESACPETFLVSSKINWAPYYKYMVENAVAGKEIAVDWTGSFATGSVELSSLGKNVAEGTQEAIDAAKADLESGKLHVYDVTTFTVGGENLASYLADVDSDAAYEHETEVIKDGYFNESGDGLRSAPFFDIQIDGITLLDQNYGG